jgi:predicted RNA-binding protein with EMAP domain
MSNPDTYFLRKEVSNSDLTELKNFLYPRTQYGDKEKAFKFGTLIDAMITEQDRVNYYKLTVDDVVYTKEDFELATEMKKALRMEARKDQFLTQVLEKSDTQKFMINKNQEFEYGNFKYTLDTRCKWDWWLAQFGFGGDLKSTFAE